MVVHLEVILHILQGGVVIPYHQVGISKEAIYREIDGTLQRLEGKPEALYPFR